MTVIDLPPRDIAGTRLHRATLLAIALLLPLPGHGATTSNFVQFDTQVPQGLFGNSWSPKILDREFFGISDGRNGENDSWNFDGDVSLGSAVFLGGTSKGRVGLEFDLTVDAGSLQASVPYDAGFDFTYAQWAPNSWVSLDPVSRLGNGSLTTSSPDFAFKADLVFESQNQLRGGACADLLVTSVCGSFDTGTALNIPKQTLTLFELGPDAANDNVIKAELLPQLQALYDRARPFIDSAKTGATLATAITGPQARDASGKLLAPTTRAKLGLKSLIDVGVSTGDIASAEVRLPELGNTGGVVGNVIQSDFAVDDFLAINVDVDNTLTSTGVLPVPLELTTVLDLGVLEAGLYGSLVDIDLDLAFGIKQKVTLTPTLTMDLFMEYADHSPVTIRRSGAVTTTHEATVTGGVPNFQVNWQGSADNPLRITPTYRLDVPAATENGLSFDLGLSLEALTARLWLEVVGIDVFDEWLGPLIDLDVPLAGGDLFALPTSYFTLGGFQSAIAGETFTFFPAATRFVGGGGNSDWSNAANWQDTDGDGIGDIGDSGNAAVIDGATSIRFGETFAVGNLAVTDDGDISISPGGALVQEAGAAVTALDNENEITVFGSLTVTTPIGGGGRLELATGSVSGPIDLHGQTVLGYGTITANNVFDIGAASSVVARSGVLNVNVNNVTTSVNQGELGAADGATLNWASQHASATRVTIDNRGGRIFATGTVFPGARVTLGHRRAGVAGIVQILGGELASDADADIQALGTLFLDGVTRGPLVTNANLGGITADTTRAPLTTLALDGRIVNDGFIETRNLVIGDPSPSQGRVGTVADLHGTGTLTLAGGTATVVSNFFSNAQSSTLRNGADHTLIGAGTIGNPTSGAFGRSRALRLENNGAIIARRVFLDNTLSDTLSFTLGTGSGALLQNRGTVQAGLSQQARGNLVLDSGRYDLAGGTLWAQYGDVTLTSNAITVGGADPGGPGGTWHAGNNYVNGFAAAIRLENSAQQWAALRDAAGHGELDNATIILEGRHSNLFLDGTPLAANIDRIGAGGKLVLKGQYFDRNGADYHFTIAGALELIDGGRFFTGQVNGLTTRLGTTLVETGGSITGSGGIASNVRNLGTIRVAGREFSDFLGYEVGRSIAITGGIYGSGEFEVADGANLFLGTCGAPRICGFSDPLVTTGTVFGSTPNTAGGIAAGTIDGARFTVIADDTQTFDSDLRVAGGPENFNAPWQLVNGARVELNGVRTKFSVAGTRPFEEMLHQIVGSQLVLANGRVFDATQTGDGYNLGSAVPGADTEFVIKNGALLQLSDAGTAFTGPATQLLKIEGGGEVRLAGGALQMGTISLDRFSRTRGYGEVVTSGALDSGSSIVNAGLIRADDGELEIRNATIANSGVLGALPVTLSDPALRDAPSVLRLTDTSVTGGLVTVGQGSKLAGNGLLRSVTLNNDGAILVDGSGGAPATIMDSTVNNASKSDMTIAGSRLVLERASVVNALGSETYFDDVTGQDVTVARRARIAATALAGDEAVLQLIDSTITGGELLLTAFLAPPAQGAPERAAALEGYGTLSGVALTVGAGALVDANVSGQTLAIDLGAATGKNHGTLQASRAFGLPLAAPGGTLELANGIIKGIGEIVATEASTVLLRNVGLEGVSLRTVDDGRIIDVATSSFSRLANRGTFEITGHATLIGNVQNEGGTIRVKSGGVVTIAEGEERFRQVSPQDLVADGRQPFTIGGGAIGGNLVVDAGGLIEGIATATGGTPGLTLDNATLRLNGGIVDASAGAVAINGTLGRLQGNGVIFGDVVNRGRVAVQNLLAFRVINTGAIIIDSPAQNTAQISAQLVNNPGGTVTSQGNQSLQFTASGVGTPHTNGGDIRAFDGGQVVFQGQLSNQAGGELQLANGTFAFDGGLVNEAGTLFISAGNANRLFGDIDNTPGGTITLTGASHTTFFDGLRNNGLLEVQSNSLAVFAGNVTGAGGYTGLGTKFFEGGFSPGSSPGLVSSEGDTIFGADAVVTMEIAGLVPGESYDQLRIGGTLNLGGTLRISLLDDFNPRAGDSFDLFDAREFSGAFAVLSFADARLGAGLRWNTAALHSLGELSVSAVPLPAAAWLMLTALATLGAGHCRARRAAGQPS